MRVRSLRKERIKNRKRKPEHDKQCWLGKGIAFGKNKGNCYCKKDKFENKKPLRNVKKGIVESYIFYVAKKACLEKNY